MTILPPTPNATPINVPDGAANLCHVDEALPEEIVFDKADEAEQEQALKEEIGYLKNQATAAAGEKKKQFADTIDLKRQQLDELKSGAKTKDNADPEEAAATSAAFPQT